MHHWKPIFNGKVTDPLSISTEHRVPWHEEPAGTVLLYSGKGTIEVVNPFHFYRIHCHAECWSCSLRVLQLKWICRIEWIPQDGDAENFGNDLLEQLQSFRAYIYSTVGKPRDVSAGARQASYKPAPHGIAALHDYGDSR